MVVYVTELRRLANLCNYRVAQRYAQGLTACLD